MIDFLKGIVVIVVLFAAYNEFLMMYREHVFNGFEFQQNKDIIISKLGEPVASHNCTAGPKPPLVPYADMFCKDTAAEIAAYKACLIDVRCPGFMYVIYDSSGRMVSRSSTVTRWP